MRPIATIAILTYQSERTLGRVLEAVFKQEFSNYDVLLIDSGSTDATLEIASHYPCQVVPIPNNVFGHGRTRNYAAHISESEFLVFLTHDSVPQKKTWLSELIRPFPETKVAGVYGRQVPRLGANYLDAHFQSTLYGDIPVRWTANNWKQGDNLFSDANSAVRRALLIEHPYSDTIIVSEDYEWATRVLRLGYDVVYRPEAAVVHSHNYTMLGLFRRNFDIGVSYRSIYANKGTRHLLLKGSRLHLRELTDLARSGNSAHVPRAMIRSIVRFLAIETGKRENLLATHWKRDYLSAQRWYWT